MAKVIGVRFRNAGKLYYFDAGENWPTPGDYVIVEASHGLEFGEVITRVQELDDAKITEPLPPMIRIATAEDVKHNEENHLSEKKAHAICQEKIADHGLDMKLVSVEYTFDNSKILFYFTANGRVDFRSLVKDLAGVFRTRIELRQIGIRDEARMLGGLGPCGRPICCGTFLGDFQPVSIKMAKEQNLSLNPVKISGVCGRLMCCLKFEEDDYEQTRKKMPKVGKEVITPDGSGIVWDLNIIKETVRVRIQKGDSSELKDYPLSEITRPERPGRQPRPSAEATVEASEDTAANETCVQSEASSQERTADKSSEKNQREMPQPVRRENPERKLNAPKPRNAKSEKQAEKETKPSAETTPVTAPTSPWKLAVQKALAASQQPAEVIEEIKESVDTEENLFEVLPDDHQEPDEVVIISDEDDTI